MSDFVETSSDEPTYEAIVPPSIQPVDTRAKGYVAWINPDGSAALVSTSGGNVVVPPGAILYEGDPFVDRQAEYREAVALATPDAKIVAAEAALQREEDYKALIAAGIPSATAARLTGGK